MSEFYLGVLIGAIVTGIVATPFLTVFGIVFFNVRRMEKQLSKEIQKPEKPVVMDEETAKTVNEAEQILKDFKQNS